MGIDNIWAPWRIGYIQDLGNKSSSDKTNQNNECFICDNLQDPDNDDQNLVLWRTEITIVIMNRFPYNNGHILIAPKRHISQMEQANDQELLELFKVVREAKKALSLAINPHGFNIGINLGRCAGAGLPGHLHIHIVPRWNGDTNFMSVCSDTKVISQSLEELLQLLKQISKAENLPNL